MYSDKHQLLCRYKRWQGSILEEVNNAPTARSSRLAIQVHCCNRQLLATTPDVCLPLVTSRCCVLWGVGGRRKVIFVRVYYIQSAQFSSTLQAAISSPHTLPQQLQQVYLWRGPFHRSWPLSYLASMCVINHSLTRQFASNRYIQFSLLLLLLLMLCVFYLALAKAVLLLVLIHE